MSRKFLGIALLILFADSIGARPAHADYYLHYWEDAHQAKGKFQIVTSARYFTSGGNYDQTGTPVIPAALNTYSRTQIDHWMGYGISDIWSVYARATFASINLTPFSGFVPPNSGFADQTLGVNLRAMHWRNGAMLNVQLQMDFPLYDNAKAAIAGVPFLGDGSTDVATGVFYTYPFTNSSTYQWRATGGAAYLIRNAGFSNAVPWSVRVWNQPKKGLLAFNAGFSGNISMNTDVTLASARTTGASGSAMVNAINPSLASALGEIGYQFERNASAGVMANTTLVGANAPRGWAIGVALHWALGDPNAHEPDENPLTERAKVSKHTGLTEYSLDAKITRINDRVNLLKINQGASAGVERGQMFDIFSVGGNGELKELVARSRVVQATDSESALEITEYFKEVWIEEGFIAKRIIR